MPKTKSRYTNRRNRSRFEAQAEINIQLQSRRQVDAIAAALGPETSHPAGRKATVRIINRGQRLRLLFFARDSPSLRAIMSSYLRMLKAITAVCGSLLDSQLRHE